MQPVIELDKIRREKRKLYLKRHLPRLDHFIDGFIKTHCDVDLGQVTALYFDMCSRADEAAWDYQDFREVLRTAIERVYYQALMAQLNRLAWFDSRWMSADLVVDRLLTGFVLARVESDQKMHRPD